MKRTRWLLCALLLAGPVRADRLTSLPPAWQERLRPVPELDLTGAEPAAREAIREARRELDRLLGEGHPSPEKLAAAWGRLAALYQRTGIDRGARIAWDNARRLEPGRFRWAFYAGHLALERGELERAREALAAAARLKPGQPVLELDQGRLALAQGRLEAAERHLQRAAESPGLRATALYHLGELALLRRQPKQAVNYLQAALQLAPGTDGIHYLLAQAWRALGDRERARSHLRRFHHKGAPPAHDPLLDALDAALNSPRTRFRLGMAAVRRHEYSKAVKYFREGLRGEPDNLHARISLARALYLSGDREAAKRQLQAVVRHANAPVLARFLLAVLAEANGDLRAARQGYAAVLAREPDHPGAHYQLAHLYLRQGEPAAAARAYEAALRADPRIRPARLLAVIARARAGAPERELAERLERLHQDAPGDPAVSRALIRLRVLAHDPGVRNSRQALELANALAPEHPAPANIEALALAAAADGQFQTAARLQQQAIDRLAWQAPPPVLARAQARLAAYRDGRLPDEPPFPEDDPLFAPPPFDATALFRDYPAAKPY